MFPFLYSSGDACCHYYCRSDDPYSDIIAGPMTRAVPLPDYLTAYCGGPAVHEEVTDCVNRLEKSEGYGDDCR